MPTQGLAAAQASQKLKEVGLNEISETKKHRLFAIFISQFTNFMVILLAAAASLSFVLSDAVDGLLIIVVIFLNGILGFIQELKAEKAIRALKKITISKVRVLRDGVETEIDGKYLVPGDVFFVEEGTKVPADGQILESFNLEVNEASLTGESLSVAKGQTLSEPGNCLFSGTVVAKGRGKAAVTTTGMSTKFGKIAQGLQSISDGPTPLQEKISRLGRELGFLGVGASVIVFFLAYLRGTSLLDSVFTSISLAVAAIPEGLPAVITVTLALGSQRMSKSHAIVRKMTAVEALGSVSVIATDKTGTLTQNVMRVREIWVSGNSYSLKTAAEIKDEPSLQKIIQISSVCNNASVVFKHDHGDADILGDVTEGSLLLMVHGLDFDPQEVKQQGKMIFEFPFDPVSKLMSTIYLRGQQKEVFTKGAPESVLKASGQILWNGQIEDLSAEKRSLVEKAFQKSAAVGLRMMAFGTKILPEPESDWQRDSVESRLVFAGFVGIADPPREEAKRAVRECRQAGIRVVMITGDNPLTANAIGTELGIIGEGEDIITGEQLEKYSDQELAGILPKVKIFARTTPEHKFRIVKALQKMGEVVAVTGDGVNDALALKQANVGVAMGKSGTDVAKEASDIVVADDNFASIVRAVEEGRVIFENVKSAVKFLIGCNAGEVLVVLAAILLGWPLIFTPIQLLYVNLITDSLPAIALALTPKHPDIMQRNPRKGREIVGHKDLFWLCEITVVTTILTLAAFYLGLQLNVSVARTMALAVLIFSQHFVLLDVWSRNKSGLNVYLFKTPAFLFAFAFPFLLQPLLMYVPQTATILNLVPLSPTLLAVTFVLPLAAFLISEARKLLLYKHLSHS